MFNLCFKCGGDVLNLYVSYCYGNTCLYDCIYPNKAIHVNYVTHSAYRLDKWIVICESQSLAVILVHCCRVYNDD